MKFLIVAFIPRLKVICYALLFTLQRLFVKLARVLPGACTALGIPHREIPDIKSWVRQQSVDLNHRGNNSPTYVSYETTKSVRRRCRAPDGLEGVHPALRNKELTFQEPFLALLPSAKMLGPEGSIISSDDGIVTESTWPRGLFQQDHVYKCLRLPAPELLPGSYYALTSRFWNNYYHWVIETLPRLFAYSSVSDESPKLIVNSPLADWQVESLNLLGFRSKNLFFLDEGYYRFEKLYFPSDIGINPKMLEWLRNALVPPTCAAAPSKRIYITRRIAARRRLLNEAELEPILLQQGFIIAELENLNFTEQTGLFGEAEIVVGLHGAGLTNMVWAPPGCRVMEIMHPNHVSAMYYMLAEVLQHRYLSVPGQTAGKDDSWRHGGSHGHGDFTLPIGLFRDALSELTT
jgi:glycosyl transferase family 61